jgi:hypothetical protein
MKKIDRNSWRGQLFVWSYSAFNQQPPQEVDLWQYCLSALGAVVFLVCAGIIFIVLNIGTIFLGVFVEPIWKPDARFRCLTFQGGIPIIAVAAPILLAIAAWRNWIAYGLADTLGPFVVTAALGFGLLGCVVLFNRMRRRLPRLFLRDGGPRAHT